MTAYPFYATPAFQAQTAYAGFVHSTYARTANLMLNGRMLTLCPADAPRVPDSIVLPVPLLQEVTVGENACLRDGVLVVGNLQLRLDAEQSWTGYLKPQSGRPKTDTFLHFISALQHGFLRLPSELRSRIDHALITAEAPGFLGLGSGLTPSFDDACVGVMAVCRALGKPAPFVLTDLSRTTDVSARYLQLAQEGYFGEAICRVMAALFGEGSLLESVQSLKNIGATSGCDMLYGMTQILA